MSDSMKSQNRPATALMTFLILLPLLLAPQLHAADDSKRQKFARLFDRVQTGMSLPEVREILGPPDDIWTRDKDPGAITTHRSSRVWRYGVDRHRQTATLGTVIFDDQLHVQYVAGGGQPPAPGMFQEAELVQIIRALGHVNSYDSGFGYNPLNTIRAVNMLHPLGKEKAVAAIAEFLRVSSPYCDEAGRKGSFLVMRSLFLPPDPPGFMRAMYVGKISPDLLPASKQNFPVFPVVMVDDVPYLCVTGILLGGEPEAPLTHLEYVQKKGQFRDRKLSLTKNPVRSLNRLFDSETWKFRAPYKGFSTDRIKLMLHEQAIRLLGDLGKVELDQHGRLLPYNQPERYDKTINLLSEQNVRWDDARLRFVKDD